VFEYFPENYTWNLAFMSGINRGGALGDLDEACRALRHCAGRHDAAAQQAWYESFMKLAERTEGLAARDEAAGNLFSAGRKYIRAGVYFLLAERMPSHRSTGKALAYGRALAAYERGYRLRGDPITPVEVPFADGALPALFSKAPAAGRSPCVVHFDGFDITKELICGAAAEEYRRRGISLLIVDHPGVGEALRTRGLPARHDTEVPAAACVDYLLTRDDVDPARIGVAGVSLGGYYAPRSAAFEPRFKCCICWGALYDFDQFMEDRVARRGEPSVPGHEDHAQWVFGKASMTEVREVTRRMSLQGVLERIRCPLLVVHGENDRQVPLWHAQRTYDEAINAPRRELKVFRLSEGGAEHCAADDNALAVDYMADWAAAILGGRRGAPGS
jgi:dienelactone hydrolase